jgi:hypothetical protein
METILLNLLITAAKPPWNYVLAGVGLALLAVPRLADLPSIFYDIKARRRALVLEKERLEILKLRYEIEALRKQHGLPELEAPALPVKILAEPERPPRPVPSAPPWLSIHPRLGKALLLMSQGILGFFLFSFGVSTVSVPLVLISETTGTLGAGDIGMLVFAPLIYGLLTWGCYAAYKKVRRWRVQIGNTP